MQSRFDRIDAARSALAFKIISANSFLSFLMIGAVYFVYLVGLFHTQYLLLILLLTSLLSYWGAPLVLILLSDRYKTNRKRMKALTKEIQALRAKALTLYHSMPRRAKGRHFKSHYDLRGSTIEDFEKAIAIGMLHEQKEVWVTAFCRSENVLKVTSTIGSKFICRPSDSVTSWHKNALRLQCNEVRQYHNHLTSRNFTRPSPQDIKTTKSLEESLHKLGLQFQSYIVYWNKILEYKILEYHGDGTHKIVKALDVSA